MKKVVMAVLVSAITSYVPVMADCLALGAGLPAGPDCQMDCSYPGPPPIGQCCIWWMDPGPCFIAYFGSCDACGGSGGGPGGECHGQRCIERLTHGKFKAAKVKPEEVSAVEFQFAKELSARLGVVVVELDFAKPVPASDAVGIQTEVSYAILNFQFRSMSVRAGERFAQLSQTLKEVGKHPCGSVIENTCIIAVSE